MSTEKMNIFEHAMKMEQDGRAFYLEHAQKTDNPNLKKILLELADDELKHFEMFKGLNEDLNFDDKKSVKTTIISSLKNIFETMRSENKDFSFDDDIKAAWKIARDHEKIAEDFYRTKGDECTSADEKEVWYMIADEEHKHWVIIEHLIQFLEKPQQSLDDAEWSGLED